MLLPLVVLAAGSSSRLGHPKQLVVFEEKTLLRRAAETALGVKKTGWETPVGVVLGANADACRRKLAGLNVTLLENPDWPEGIASSVRVAVAWAEAHCADGLLLLLCDQPFVTADLLETFLETFEKTAQSLVASDYGDGVRGVPVLVGKRFFAELKTLHGDRGAQGLLKRYPDVVATVPFPEGRFDLDTPEELRWLGAYSVKGGGAE